MCKLLASAAAMLRHKKCHQSPNTESDEENDPTESGSDESDVEIERNLEIIDNDRMPLFDNIFEKLASPFLEVDE